jgi:hypothetical protein
LPLNQATRSFANVLMRAASSVSMNGRYPALRGANSGICGRRRKHSK